MRKKILTLAVLVCMLLNVCSNTENSWEYSTGKWSSTIKSENALDDDLPQYFVCGVAFQSH